MKHIFLLMGLVAAAGFVSSYAQTYKEWDDVSVTHLNRERAHTLGIPLADVQALDTEGMEQSPYFKSLNGVWKFKWVADPGKRPEGFEAADYSIDGWDDIDVPSAYYIQEAQSGLFLHSDKSGTDGKFRLGRLDVSDHSYQFTPKQRDKFTTFFSFRTGDGYMTEGESYWKIGLGNNEPEVAKSIQVEAHEDGYHMRAMWKGSNEYFGVDSRQIGSYVYTDKKTPVLFRFLTLEEAGIAPLLQDVSDICVHDADGKICVKVKDRAMVHVSDTDGTLLAKERIVDYGNFPISKPGVYIVSVTPDGRATSVHKLAVK